MHADAPLVQVAMLQRAVVSVATAELCGILTYVPSDVTALVMQLAWHAFALLTLVEILHGPPETHQPCAGMVAGCTCVTTTAHCKDLHAG